jgi:hypothetical protein
MMNDPDIHIRQLLNRETGKVTWPELQRHFARGSVIKVDPELDLIEVAAKMVEDDIAAIEKLNNSAAISRASMDDARLWEETQPIFWTVVVAPWVLIQPISELPESADN